MASFKSQPDHYDVIKNTEDPIVTWESLTYYEGALRARLDLKTDVTVTEALAARVTQNEADIDDLDRRKEEKTDADKVRERVTNLENTKADKTELEKTNHHLQDVENRVTHNEGDISNLSSQLTTETGNLHDEIEGLQSSITSLTNNYNQLYQSSGQTVDVLHDNVESLKSRLDDLAKEVGDGPGIDLSGFVTKGELNSSLSLYATKNDIKNYYTKTESDSRYVLRTTYEDKIDEIEAKLNSVTGKPGEGPDLSDYLTKKSAESTYLKKADFNTRAQSYLESKNGKDTLYGVLDTRYLQTADFESKLISELKKTAVRDELDTYLNAKKGKDALHEALDAWYLKISDFDTKVKDYLDAKNYLTKAEADKLYAKIGSGGGGSVGTSCDCLPKWTALESWKSSVLSRLTALENKSNPGGGTPTPTPGGGGSTGGGQVITGSETFWVPSSSHTNRCFSIDVTTAASSKSIQFYESSFNMYKLANEAGVYGQGYHLDSVPTSQFQSYDGSSDNCTKLTGGQCVLCYGNSSQQMCDGTGDYYFGYSSVMSKCQQFPDKRLTQSNYYYWELLCTKATGQGFHYGTVKSMPVACAVFANKSSDVSFTHLGVIKDINNLSKCPSLSPGQTATFQFGEALFQEKGYHVVGETTDGKYFVSNELNMDYCGWLYTGVSKGSIGITPHGGSMKDSKPSSL